MALNFCVRPWCKCIFGGQCQSQDRCHSEVQNASCYTSLPLFWLSNGKSALLPGVQMSWLSSPILQDQFDNLEKHTQWGIEYLEKYTKFVKERSEIELNYAKQIRWALERGVQTGVRLLRLTRVKCPWRKMWNLSQLISSRARPLTSH